MSRKPKKQIIGSVQEKCPYCKCGIGSAMVGALVARGVEYNSERQRENCHVEIKEVHVSPSCGGEDEANYKNSIAEPNIMSTSVIVSTHHFKQ